VINSKTRVSKMLDKGLDDENPSPVWILTTVNRRPVFSLVIQNDGS
jgi:hypothetical protein